MPVEPKEIAYDLGQDIFGRAVTLRWGKDYMGRAAYRIQIAPSNQRDEGGRIESLSPENLRRIAAIAETLRG